MNDTLLAILSIAIMAVITAALRMLPFLIFSGKKETPKIISYLGNVLPFAIMGMLVVYCLKSTNVVAFPWGIPEAISCLVVIFLHAWKHNTLISIVAGTACYMLLVQLAVPYLEKLI